ncbi:NAD-dependent epimerase/dehydratase family protein [Syntrophorhabdus aromaticivorans]|jgi:UDP-glucose 4-epimerase|nr:NAD-dependent epimerase/dehydratase family protein [Syntrophorhabdus aromaticivorans]
MMKVLVTGGCGFIASHVVDAYVDQGHEVVIVDNLSTGKMENKNKKANLYRVDICEDGVAEVFAREKPDVVNHHAAQISVPLSVEKPLLDAETNIKGTIRLLELSKEYGVKKFLFSSTGGAIYGEAERVPTDEDYPPVPASPYAISKFACEKYIQYYHKQFGLKYTILRYSNVFGPRQIPHGEAGVVAIFAEKLLNGQHPTLNHFPDEKRGMIRDYCFVKDIARASILATESQKVGIFNIGTGKGTHTIDLYRETIIALRNNGTIIPQAFDEPRRDVARAGDIRVSTLDPTKAKRDLDWEAAYDLAGGLLETIQWYSGHAA